MEERKELSVKENVEKVHREILELQNLVREVKKITAVAGTEIMGMEAKIDLITNDTPRSFFPQIEEIFKDLRSEVTVQRNQNESLQKQITELKKEKSLLSQHIVVNNSKVSILNEKVGVVSKYE